MLFVLLKEAISSLFYHKIFALTVLVAKCGFEKSALKGLSKYAVTCSVKVESLSNRINELEIIILLNDCLE